jgi:aldehyde:ferredoxin oxidoreductase
MCSAYGLDTISTGMAISFAMDCYERGLLTRQQSDGLKMRFGSADVVLRLIELIARRQGIGDLLAHGTRRAAERVGSEAEECALHVMGLELPLQEPRLAHHRGLGYVVGPTGADHLVGAPETFFEQEGPRLENFRALGAFNPSPLHGFDSEKLRLYTYSHIWNSFANCAVLCLFLPYSFDQVRQLVWGMTGWNSSVWELMKVGERAATMARAFNAREGLGPDLGRLPGRFHKRLPAGPLHSVALEREGMARAREGFYGMMGWDPKTGVPARGKLQELGIGWVEERGVETDGL